MEVRDGPTLSSPISPIACVSPGVSDICMSSSSSVVSDESDGDAGLLSALLGSPSLRLPHNLNTQFFIKLKDPRHSRAFWVNRALKQS